MYRIVWCSALYLLHKLINSHESRFDLFGLLTNFKLGMCFIAASGRKPVTLRSLVQPSNSTMTHNSTLKM